MYTVNNCPHYGCGDCVYFKVDADRAESLCKRINHKKIKFAVPWFKSYDCGQSFHLPCNAFMPKYMERADAKDWTNFEDFWRAYVKAWLPYQNEDILVWFCINDDITVRYGVPLKSFLDGTMIKDNKLMAIKKQYFKRTNRNEIGYTIINEDIQSVELGDNNGQN